MRVRLRFANKGDREYGQVQEPVDSPDLHAEDPAHSLALLSQSIEEQYDSVEDEPDETPLEVPETLSDHDSLAEIRAAWAQITEYLGIENPAKAGIDPGSNLKNRRVALLGFDSEPGAELRMALEAEGAVAAAMAFSSPNIPLVCQLFDLIIWGISSENAVPTEEQLEELRSRRKATLFVGPRRWVAPVALSQTPGLWDYVEGLRPMQWVLWRIGTLARLNQNRNGVRPSRDREDAETALVIDDNALSRALVERTLTSSGMECMSLPEDVGVFDFVQQNRPSVVIMELKTSTEQGFELLQRLRQELDLAATRIVVLSEQREEADVVRAFGLGADDFVTKPFSPLEVAARVMRLVRPA